MSNKHFLLKAAALGLALAIAGCGGGGGSSGGSSDTAPGGSTGGPQFGGSDSFIERVIAVINNTSDTAEPEDIGSITTTSPDNTSPVPIS